MQLWIHWLEFDDEAARATTNSFIWQTHRKPPQIIRSTVGMSLSSCDACLASIEKLRIDASKSEVATKIAHIATSKLDAASCVADTLFPACA